MHECRMHRPRRIDTMGHFCSILENAAGGRGALEGGREVDFGGGREVESVVGGVERDEHDEEVLGQRNTRGADEHRHVQVPDKRFH